MHDTIAAERLRNTTRLNEWQISAKQAPAVQSDLLGPKPFAVEIWADLKLRATTRLVTRSVHELMT
jgi:hypothetical protein